jgi:hypothetical protein
MAHDSTAGNATWDPRERGTYTERPCRRLTATNATTRKAFTVSGELRAVRRNVTTATHDTGFFLPPTSTRVFILET